MRTLAFCALVLLCLAAGAPAQPPATPPPLAIALEADKITATGVTPGGKVIWFSVWREFPESSLRVTRVDDVSADDDRDGTVALELDRPSPYQSVWVAVDLSSGALAIEAPPGYPLQTRTFRPGAIRRGGGGEGDFLEEEKRYLQLLLVRPGVGAWSGTVGDGGTTDLDGEGDGRLVYALDLLEPLAESAVLQPAVLKPSDIFVSIDIDSLETTLVRWMGAPQTQ
jgi:hypothetical protein